METKTFNRIVKHCKEHPQTPSHLTRDRLKRKKTLFVDINGSLRFGVQLPEGSMELSYSRLVVPKDLTEMAFFLSHAPMGHNPEVPHFNKYYTEFFLGVPFIWEGKSL